ncbi:MAG: ribbon-helix-helix protein, CopG family [Archaeoglobales archaeon]|nr:ribbon-helix-helix protein, CopG family [Archaeoglobales archaeon]
MDRTEDLGTKPKAYSLTKSYVEKVKRIRAHLGVPSDSEAIRRAIDFFIEERIEKSRLELEKNRYGELR